MTIRIAFVGFRHDHIFDIFRAISERDVLDFAGAAEDHLPTVESVREQGVELTHASVFDLIDDVKSYDVLAIGDYFGRRGELAVRALQHGKHVISDKPLCTRLEELDAIESLHEEKSLAVGCQLNLRDHSHMRTLKRLVADGAIGRVQTVNFMGQHPLFYGKRAGWYFEEGKHGGTINDIGIHGLDLLPWILGVPVTEIIAARVWNARIEACPWFNVGAQMMLKMADDTGVIGDVSYLSPDGQGYSVPQYWRITLHGEKGIMETCLAADSVQIWRDTADSVENIPLDSDRKYGYLDDFLAEISGRSNPDALTTEQVLASTRLALMAQKAAEDGLTFLQV